jgi:N-acetylmuramoyl-L-alanine amidase
MNREAAINMIEKGLEILKSENDYEFEHPPKNTDPTIGIAFIIGHTETAKGAYSSYFKQSEYDFWRHRVRHFTFECLDLGVNSQFFTRDGVGVAGAYQKANEWLEGVEKKCIVELHFNAFNKKATGTEVLYVHDTAKEGILATEVSHAMATVLGLRDRGAKDLKPGQAGHYNVTRISEYPSILLEPFFGDNIDDCKAFERNEELFYRNVVLAIKNNL